MILSQLRRIAIAAGIVLLLFPVVAAADVLSVDLDGDRVPDEIIFSTHSNDLAIQLSHRARATARMHLRARVLRIVAVDVDHDGDVDIVASTSSSELRFWINNGRGRFSAPKPIRRGDRWSTPNPRVDNSQRDDGGAELQQIATTVITGRTGLLQPEARGQPCRLLFLDTFVLRPLPPPGALRGPPSALL